jgi:hypothetical protein
MVNDPLALLTREMALSLTIETKRDYTQLLYRHDWHGARRQVETAVQVAQHGFAPAKGVHKIIGRHGAGT